MSVPALPIWFGDEQAPLFGLLHCPEQARGGVVLCPPIGEDASVGARALRRLAVELAQEGLVALRFDYTGTGDSADPPSQEETLSRWVGDVRLAAQVVQSLTDGPLTVVGMRLGALLARHGAIEANADGLVLWDGYLCGHRFLREQSALGLISGTAALPHDETGSLELPGLVLAPRLREELKGLDLHARGAPYPDHVLAVDRLDARSSPLGRELPTSTQWEVSEDPDRFYGGDINSLFLPLHTIGLVARACAQWATSDKSTPPRRRGGSLLAPYRAGDALVPVGHTTVIERPLYVNDKDLFAIVTEPSGECKGPPVLFLNTGVDRHVGPSRLWVTLARRWAALGIGPIARIDVRGIGESSFALADAKETAYPPTAVDDVVAAARLLAPDDPASVRIIGLCSGAYHAASAAALLSSRAISLINPAVPQRSAVTARRDGENIRLHAARRSTRLASRLSRERRVVRLAHRFVPRAGWWLLDLTRIYGYPARPYERLVRHGTMIQLICGTQEASMLVRTGDRLVARLERSGRFRLEIVPELDHALRSAPSRQAVLERLERDLCLAAMARR
jgi:predicted alpha/beta hydrolase